jgi:hypothetical protein
MSSKIKLKKSLRSINDAKSALQRALPSSDSNASIYIRRAIGELEDAETGIKRAIRELPA